MFVLYMYNRKTEQPGLEAIACSESEQALIDLVEVEKIDPPVRDESGATKYFRKYGPLEWFSPFDYEIKYMGTEKEAMLNAKKQYRETINKIPHRIPVYVEGKDK